jgi:hypothetical protein
MLAKEFYVWIAAARGIPAAVPADCGGGVV